MNNDGWQLIEAHGTSDQANVDTTTIVRPYDIRTPKGAAVDQDVLDVIARYPQFTPGRVVGGRKVANVTLDNADTSDDWLRLSVEYQTVQHSDPFRRPMVWTWESSKLQIPAYIDVDGKIIQTTAGEPIPGVMRPVTLWNLRGTRNVPGVPQWLIGNEYGASVNSDSVTIDGISFRKNYLQVERITFGTWQEEINGNKTVAFREMSVELWFNPLSWTEKVLNKGYNELLIRTEVLTRNGDGSPKTTRRVPYQIRAKNNAGEDVAQPVFLDATGKRPRDRDGLIKEQLATEDIVILNFNIQERLPYRPLLG